MILTKAGFEAEKKDKIDPKALEGFFASKEKEYKIIATVVTDVQIPEIFDIKIDNNSISIEQQPKNQGLVGDCVYKVTANIIAQWHNIAEDILEKFINDYFTLLGSHIEIKRPFVIYFKVNNQWHSHPSMVLSMKSIRHVADNEAKEAIELSIKINSLRYSNTPKSTLDKFEKILSLLKRGTLLKNSYRQEAFLCFYKVTEMISEDLKINIYSSLEYPDDVLEMSELGVI
ncbi:hypothetical protein [Thiothrix nivea]|uniref:Uncharacterized protein n=1 Tax=Thiothrix nivea (strain ATCC 35100 / DSM 5205 / JP2) TaxID=870187 RepID=A0A656HPM3_THINJ|nr:hypothetical protein [Thiothrix nivea]EIJ37015.1 hypothetical protein Thini_0069 [Thiothrix nivea DSM 5205]